MMDAVVFARPDLNVGYCAETPVGSVTSVLFR
jgi:hypothetical protein